MRNVRSRNWFWFAALVMALGAGCAEGAYDDGPPVGSGTSAIDLPAAHSTLRRFRSPRVDADLTRETEKKAKLPANFRERRPGEPRDAIPSPASPAPDGADQRRLPEEDDCFRRCGDEAVCRLACLDGLVLDERADDDCLRCGRETGFLPRPELWVENIFEGKAVELRWSRIDGADRYVIYGIQWPYRPETEPVSMSWATEGVSLRAELEPGFVYVFYVVALGADGVQSKPSSPVTVRL